MSILKRSSVFVGAIGPRTRGVHAGACPEGTDHPRIGSGPDLPVLRPHDEPDEGRGREARRHHGHRERRPGLRRPSRPPTSRRRSPRASTASSSARTRSTPWRRRCKQAVDASIPVVTIDRRVDKVPGILAHVGADNVKGGEAQGELIMKLFPNGATIINLQGQSGASPAIDRNKGLHNVLDKACRQVQVRVRADRQLRPRQGPVGHRSRRSPAWTTPPDVIVAAQRRHDRSARSRR